MDNEYIIMSEVLGNESITQRELSKKLGISVSTVNVLMNKMIREGLVKMTLVSQKQVLYMLTPMGMMEKAQKTVRYLKGHYRAIYETKERLKSYLDELNKDYEVIYVLLCNDEMNEILTIAVNEFKSKNSKSNINIIQSVVDIDVKDYKSSILLHMTVDEKMLTNDAINEYEDTGKLEIKNLAEIL